MKATIWAPAFVMPSGFCFNCGDTATATVGVANEGGLAAGRTAQAGVLGAVAGALRDHVLAKDSWSASYCAHCAVQAKACIWEDLPNFLVRGRMKPGQTIVGRAFRVINAGKDLFRGNKPFVQVLLSNPRVLEEIRALNPDLRIT